VRPSSTTVVFCGKQLQRESWDQPGNAALRIQRSLRGGGRRYVQIGAFRLVHQQLLWSRRGADLAAATRTFSVLRHQVLELYRFAMKPTILVVDDYPDNRDAYATVLEHFGYSAVTAINGLEGVERARALLPDMILMDISMPILDGIDATRLLRQDDGTRHIPIVAITANDDADIRARAAEAGMDGFLTKPCLPMRIIDEVERRLGRGPSGSSVDVAVGVEHHRSQIGASHSRQAGVASGHRGVDDGMAWPADSASPLDAHGERCRDGDAEAEHAQKRRDQERSRANSQ